MPPVTRTTPALTTAVRVEAFLWLRDAIDISDIVIEFSWNESADKASVEATFSFDNSSGIAKDITPGTWLRVAMQDPVTKKWAFIMPLMYVWARSFSDKTRNVMAVTCFDACSFLQRQGEADYFFRSRMASHPRGWLASEIATKILTDLEVRAEVVTTRFRIPYLMLKSVTPYEAILKAFARDKMASGVRYRIRAGQFSAAGNTMVDLDKVIIEPAIRTDSTWRLATGSNIISSDWYEGLDNVVTDVTGIAVTTDGREIGRVSAVSRNIGRYGRLKQYVVLPPRDSAELQRRQVKQYLLNHGDLSRRVTIEAEGIPFVRAADSIHILDSGLNLAGLFFVSTVSHSVNSGGQHSMTVELDRVAEFPTAELDNDEIAPESNTTASYDLGGTLEGATIGQRVVKWALGHVGDRYVLGANGPDVWDCSSFSQAAWASVGVAIPRTVGSGGQENVGQAVPSIAQAQPGDLLCRIGGAAGGHVAIYMGNGQVVHAKGSAYGVRTDPVSAISYSRIRRPASEGTTVSFKSGALPSTSVRLPADQYVFAPGQIDSLLSASEANASAITGTSTTYPGNSAGKKAIARWMGARAEAAGLPPELPVMAALAESQMRFNAIGDSGSAVGYFQIHPDRAKDDGFDPNDRTSAEMQIRWFIQEANQRKAKWASKGPESYHKWIQDIEVSGNPSGSQYAAQYTTARKLLGLE